MDGLSGTKSSQAETVDVDTSDPNSRVLSFGTENELHERVTQSREGSSQSNLDSEPRESSSDINLGPDVGVMVLEDEMLASKRKISALQKPTRSWQSEQDISKLKHETDDKEETSAKANSVPHHPPSAAKPPRSSTGSTSKARPAPVKNKGKSYDNIFDYVDDDTDDTKYPLPSSRRGAAAPTSFPNPAGTQKTGTPEHAQQAAGRRVKGGSKTVEEPLSSGSSGGKKKKMDRSKGEKKGNQSIRLSRQLQAQQKASGGYDYFRTPSDATSVASDAASRRGYFGQSPYVEVRPEEQERRLEALKTLMAGARQRGVLGNLGVRRPVTIKGDKAAFSSEHFWVELRARVLKKSVEEEWEAVRARRDRVQAVIDEVEGFRFVNAQEGREGGREGEGAGNRETPSTQNPPLQTHDAALAVHPRLPLELQKEIKEVRFSVGGGGRERERELLKLQQGRLEAAVKEVRGVLGRVEDVVEGAFASVFRKQPRALAHRFPDINRAPFSSRLEALHRWQEAAAMGARALAELRRARDEGSWQAPDLGGLLHRVGMQDVTALLLSKARPALRAMHTLHHPASTPPARRRPAQATGAEWRGVGGGGGGGGGGRAARKGGRAERGESVQESALALQSELRAREYGRLLGPEEMALPSLVGKGSLAAELAGAPLEILKQIVTGRVKRLQKRPRGPMAGRGTDVSVVQQRFAECVQLIWSAREFAEELREFLDDDVSAGSTSSGESDLDGIRGWAGATRLEEKLVAVLLLLFDLARARSLPDGLRGAKGARELQAAAVALGSEEAPQIIALLPIFPRVEVMVEAGQRHCALLETLLQTAARLLAEVGSGAEEEEGGREREDEEVVEACKAVVGVAKEACGSMGKSLELKATGDVTLLLRELRRARYTWLRGTEGVLPGRKDEECVVVLGSAALMLPNSESRASGNHKFGVDKCKAMLCSTYGVSLDHRPQNSGLESDRAESGDLPMNEGHILTLCIPRTQPGFDSMDAFWTDALESGEGGATAAIEGLDELLEGAELGGGVGILLAARAEAVEEELQSLQDLLSAAANVRAAVEDRRPLQRNVGEAVAKVREALCALEDVAEEQMMRWSAGVASAGAETGESGPEAAQRLERGSEGGAEDAAMSREQDDELWRQLAQAQQLMDLITGSALPRGAEMVSGKYRLSVARRWVDIRQEAGKRMREDSGLEGRWRGAGEALIVRTRSWGAEKKAAEVGRFSRERLRYVEGAVRGALGELSEAEWTSWREFLEEAWSGGAGTGTGRPRTMLLARLCCAEIFRARVVRKKGGEVEARRKKIEELEVQLQEQSQKRRNAGKVQEEKLHQERMVVKNEVGKRLVWIMGNRLGEGSFGKVFRAQFWHSMEFVAVKMVDGTKEDKETELMRKLWHPNIVRFYGKETDGLMVYILMEYCAQGDLRDLVLSWRESKLPQKSSGRRQENMSIGFGTGAPGGLEREVSGVGEREGSMESWMKGKYPIVSVDIVRQYARQLADGLGYMHSQDMVHRDLKAPNVLVAGDGQKVKITDLGCAVEKPAGGAWADVMRGSAGTCGHQAPEVLDRVGADGKRLRGELGPKVDVWSLGCVITEMLTGELPELMIWRGGFVPDHPQARFYRLHKMPPTDLVLPYRDHFALEALPQATAFLDACFAVHPSSRSAAYDLVHHEFLNWRFVPG